jgi:hypothetical protein
LELFGPRAHKDPKKLAAALDLGLGEPRRQDPNLASDAFFVVFPEGNNLDFARVEVQRGGPADQLKNKVDQTDCLKHVAKDSGNVICVCIDYASFRPDLRNEVSQARVDDQGEKGA